MYKWLNTVLCIFAVTPHAGVRIEIDYLHKAYSNSRSPPTRGCELKYVTEQLDYDANWVTPHAGVRIEISSRCMDIKRSRSPPTRGCELK